MAILREVHKPVVSNGYERRDADFRASNLPQRRLGPIVRFAELVRNIGAEWRITKKAVATKFG
jgi:hypothetical protein